MIGDEQVAPVSRDLVVFDLWNRSFETLPLAGLAAADCPACHGTYEFLEGRQRTRVTSLCGQNAVQIWNTAAGRDALGPGQGAAERPRIRWKAASRWCASRWASRNW